MYKGHLKQIHKLTLIFFSFSEQCIDYETEPFQCYGNSGLYKSCENIEIIVFDLKK